MDVTKLRLLKDISADTSVLYVEDSLTLQKQVGQFLGNIFDRFFQAYDGNEGLEVFKQELPDIVITDITMPQKNGLEMIDELRSINPDVKIIVLTAYSDVQNLYKAIEHDIISYLVKPLDIDKLIDLLIESIDDLVEVHFSRAVKDLSIIMEHNSADITFLNSYKGISVTAKGVIKKISQDNIVVKVPSKQMAVMKHEKSSIIQLPVIDKYIKAKVATVSYDDGLVILSEPRYINYKSRKSNHKRLKVDETFKIGLHHNKHTYNVYPYDASFTSLAMVIEEEDVNFDIDDEINITVAFEVTSVDKSNMFVSNKHHIMYVKSKVIRIKKINNSVVVALLLDIKAGDQNTYSDYLAMIEEKLTKELNNL